MPIVVDLALYAASRNALQRTLAERGLGFFVKPCRGHAPHLDARRIAWVVEAARRAQPAHPADPDALGRARRVVRRELVRRLAAGMVSAGL